MKAKRGFEPHLVVSEISLRQGTEWVPPSLGWCFVHVTRGVGYWLHPKGNHELATGAAVLFSDRIQGTIRASQVADVLIQYFKLQPERLTGLLTLSEQQFLQNAAAVESQAIRIFRTNDALAEHFRKACETAKENNFRQRLQLLDLFVHAFGNELPQRIAGPGPAMDAKARLVQILNQTTIAELLELSFAELVKEMRCTPRHLSRMFHQVVGMSFREKQAQVRLIRAQELLATTRSKVVEVALESGYQSLSLFNLMFKKRFGMTPGKWRQRTQKSFKKTAPRLLASRV